MRVGLDEEVGSAVKAKAEIFITGRRVIIDLRETPERLQILRPSRVLKTLRGPAEAVAKMRRSALTALLL